MKQLTESQAWRAMAEWCAEHDALLCVVFEDMWKCHRYTPYDKPPFSAPWKKMYDDVSEMASRSEVMTAYPMFNSALAVSDKNQDARIIFCLLMAEVTK